MASQVYYILSLVAIWYHETDRTSCIVANLTVVAVVEEMGRYYTLIAYVSLKHLTMHFWDRV